MKSRRRVRKNKSRRMRGGKHLGQYLSNVGWSTGVQRAPMVNLRGYDSSLAGGPGLFSRTTTNWV